MTFIAWHLTVQCCPGHSEDGFKGSSSHPKFKASTQLRGVEVAGAASTEADDVMEEASAESKLGYFWEGMGYLNYSL